MYVYKTTSMFTSGRKYKLIKLLTFVRVLTFIKYLGAIKNRRRQLFCQFDNAFFQYMPAIARQLLRADMK